MQIAANVLVGLVGALHVWFLVFEVFLWTKPATAKMFGMSEQLARESQVLAANQGVYNGFLAAALFLSLVVAEPTALAFKLYGCGCVVVAGLYGGYSANKAIWAFQALPGAVALAVVWVAFKT
jgi:putative membrane protein